ncbi:hypothetical protein [Streptomyces sp. NPDC017556]
MLVEQVEEALCFIEERLAAGRRDYGACAVVEDLESGGGPGRSIAATK